MQKEGVPSRQLVYRSPPPLPFFSNMASPLRKRVTMCVGVCANKNKKQRHGSSSDCAPQVNSGGGSARAAVRANSGCSHVNFVLLRREWRMWGCTRQQIQIIRDARHVCIRVSKL